MHNSPSRTAVLIVRDDIEAVRVEFITRDKQGQIEIGSAAFLCCLAAIQAIKAAPSAGENLGSLFTNLGRRGIVRAVRRLGDLGTTAR
jgi:hypothetical protein